MCVTREYGNEVNISKLAQKTQHSHATKPEIKIFLIL